MRSKTWQSWSVLLGVITIAIGICSATRLLKLSAAIERRIRTSEGAATQMPGAISLSGKNTILDAEWTPKAREHAPTAAGQPTIDVRPLVVMFPVARDWRAADMSLWRAVALRTLADESEVQFVGVCIAQAMCGVASDTEPPITFLTSMEPIQMRALAVAAKSNQAFFFQGTTRRVVAFDRDPEVLYAGLKAAITKSKPLESR
jgi:hypothetical protein